MGFPDGPAFLTAYRGQTLAVRGLVDEIWARLGLESGGDPLREALLSADTPGGAKVLRRSWRLRGFPEPDTAGRALVRLASGAPSLSHPAATRRLSRNWPPRCSRPVKHPPTRRWPSRPWPISPTGSSSTAPSTKLPRGPGRAGRARPLRRRRASRSAHRPPLPGALRRGRRRGTPLAAAGTGSDAGRSRRASAAGRQLRAAPLGLAAVQAARVTVRLSARHVLQPVSIDVETGEWSDLAEVLVRAALDAALGRLRDEARSAREDAADFAVLALGRFGGRDLHFASDLDLVYAFDSGSGLPQQQYELLAKALGEALQTVTEEGRLFEVDLRLRPEGRQGAPVTNLEAARRYYGPGGRAQTWEYQMLTRARPVAGSPEVAAEFLSVVRPRVYRSPMPAEWRDEIAGHEAPRRDGAGGRARPSLAPEAGPGRALRRRVPEYSPFNSGMGPKRRRCGHVDGGGHPRSRRGRTPHPGPGIAAPLGPRAPDTAAAVAQPPADGRLSRRAAGPDGEARLGRALARAMGCPDMPALQEVFRAHTIPVRELFLQHLSHGL